MTDRHVNAAVARLQRGDIGGLAVLVEQYQVRATRIAYLITQDHMLAEDIVQSAFVRVYTRADQFDSARPFAPWFFRIVANAAVQASRGRDRHLSLDTPSDEADETLAERLPDLLPGPDEQVEQSELRRAVQESLDRLTPAQRAVLVERYYFDLTDEELAGRAQVQPGTVRWRLHTARKRLRGFLYRLNITAPESGEG